MINAMCLLGALGDPLINKLDPSKVLDIASIRNKSVYAHGIQPIDETSVRIIRELATDVLHQYIMIIGIDSIEEQRARFEFMKLVIREKQDK